MSARQSIAMQSASTTEQILLIMTLREIEPPKELPLQNQANTETLLPMVTIVALLALPFVIWPSPAGCQTAPEQTIVSKGGTPSLNGRWEFGILDTKGQNHLNHIIITQRGRQISGQGEEGSQHFLLDGVYRYPKVQLRKIYVDAASSQSIQDAKPIKLFGRVDWMNDKPGKSDIPYYLHMSGYWMQQKHIGWRAQMNMRKFVPVSNRWEAGLLQPVGIPETKPYLY